MKTDTGTLIQALKILSEDIQSADGVANTAILEGAHRLEELVKELEAVKANMEILDTYHKNINQIKADAVVQAVVDIDVTPAMGSDVMGTVLVTDLLEYANSLINKEG